MKRVTIIILLLSISSSIANAQDYFSTYNYMGEVFNTELLTDINGEDYILTNQFYSQTEIIHVFHKINDDGSLQPISSFEDEVGNYISAKGTDEFFLAGSDNLNLYVSKFDFDFNSLVEDRIVIPSSSEFLELSSIFIEEESFVVILHSTSGFNNNTLENGFMYRFDRTDLSLINSRILYSDNDVFDFISCQEIDDGYMCFRRDNDIDAGQSYFRYDTYDLDFNTIDSTITNYSQFTGGAIFTPYLNSKNEVLMFDQNNPNLRRFRLDGTLIGSVPISNLFEEETVSVSIKDWFEDVEGNIVLSGFVRIYIDGIGLKSSGFIGKINPLGQPIWSRVFDDTFEDNHIWTRLNFIEAIDDGFLSIGDNAFSTSSSGADWQNENSSEYTWIVKLDKDGCIMDDDCPNVVSSIHESNTSLVDDLFNVVTDNYNELLIIDILKSGLDELSLYDISGKLIYRQGRTNDQVTLGTNNLVSGMYILKAENQQKEIQVEKVIIE